jgi:hypothetical protein
MEIKELRQNIIDQKRIEMEKDRTIAYLEAQNGRYIREIEQQDEAVTFAKSIIVAVQDFQQTKSRKPGSSSVYQASPVSPISPAVDPHGDAISAVIDIFNQI